MKRVKQLNQEFMDLDALGSLVRAYAQIAAGRMKKTRDSVLSMRDFMIEIRDVFEDIHYSYRRQVGRLAKKKKGGKGGEITFLAHNGRTVAVWLSANAGLYGEVVNKSFTKFWETVKGGEAEATVVGKMGQTMWLKTGSKVPYTYFDLPDFGTDREQVIAIVRHLVQYERVLVFFGKYRSIVNQDPEVAEISAEGVLSAGGKTGKERLKYYFEPTLEELLMFFESEMFAALFEQTVKEGQLAKLASRMLAMDKAGENVKLRIGRLSREKLKLKHALGNRKQLSTWSGSVLW